MTASPDPVRRIARLFRWYIVAGTAVVLACAACFWILLLTGDRSYHGSGATGSPVTITGSAAGPARLEVYTDRRSTAECVPSDHGVYFFPADLLAGEGEATSDLQHDGKQWFRAGYLTDGWRAGQTITCPVGDGRTVLLSVDAAATWRPYALGLTGGGIILAIGAGVFVALGRRDR